MKIGIVELISCVLGGEVSVRSVRLRPAEFPAVAARIAEIAESAFSLGRPDDGSIVSTFANTGLPSLTRKVPIGPA